MTEHVDTIKKIASGFASTTGMEYEELVGVASISYTKAQQSYKAGHGSALPTWLYANMRNALIDYVRKERTRMSNYSPAPVPEQVGWRNPERDLMFHDSISQLSKKARKLCQMVFSDPTQFVGMNQKELLEHLRQQGWTYPNIWSSFKEIKTALNYIKEE